MGLQPAASDPPIESITCEQLKRAVDRLNLALFIDGQDDGVRWRIDIEPSHVAQFVDEV
jgi:hypothetical protein